MHQFSAAELSKIIKTQTRLRSKIDILFLFCSILTRPTARLLAQAFG